MTNEVTLSRMPKLSIISLPDLLKLRQRIVDRFSVFCAIQVKALSNTPIKRTNTLLINNICWVGCFFVFKVISAAKLQSSDNSKSFLTYSVECFLPQKTQKERKRCPILCIPTFFCDFRGKKTTHVQQSSTIVFDEANVLIILDMTKFLYYFF